MTGMTQEGREQLARAYYLNVDGSASIQAVPDKIFQQQLDRMEKRQKAMSVLLLTLLSKASGAHRTGVTAELIDAVKTVRDLL